jgi:hypothetical protein
MNEHKPTRGVYFLANNAVFEQVVAFLRSFRTHNPTIPLCLIPYNDAFDRIAVLQDTYSFSVFDNTDLLAECDAISEKFHGFVLGAYRKLVAWEGIFDSFIYIDVDTVVIDSIDFAFDGLKYAAYVASHSNLANIRQFVWKDSIYKTHLLTRPQIEFATNTGFFASWRGLLPMKHCIAKVDGALELKDHMELSCMEQPFLNYLVVTSGYACTSLLVLRDRGVMPSAALEFWGGSPDARVEGGKLYPPYDAPVFLVHWAGFTRGCENLGEALPYKELWNFYRRSDIPPTDFNRDVHSPV